jgi:outer membrane protein assembly factor BamE (lipoprotein component of BamABCDE complex)
MSLFEKHSRAVALISGISLVVLVCVGWILLLTRNSASKLTRENYRKIKAGMELSEVESILGAPPSMSSKGPDTSEGFSGWAPKQVRWTAAEGWVDDQAELTVLFDEDGKTVDCRYYPGGPPASLLRLIRNYLGW